MSEDDGKVTGRGGPGRGQGLKPMFGDEAMPKRQFRMIREMRDFLFLDEDEETAAERLRRLIEWSRNNPDKLLDYKHKRGTEMERTSFALTPAHLEQAKKVGGGVLVKGIRRIVHTAMKLGIDV